MSHGKNPLKMVMFQYSYLSHSQAGYPIQGTCTSWWTSRSFVSQRWSSWAWGLHGGERCVSCLYNEPRSAARREVLERTGKVQHKVCCVVVSIPMECLWNIYGISMEYLWCNDLVGGILQTPLKKMRVSSSIGMTFPWEKNKIWFQSAPSSLDLWVLSD